MDGEIKSSSAFSSYRWMKLIRTVNKNSLKIMILKIMRYHLRIQSIKVEMQNRLTHFEIDLTFNFCIKF